MTRNESNNHAPIFTFLNKHKWRIILPMIFALFYFALPRYQTKIIAVQQELFIKSPAISADELARKAETIKTMVHSEEFLQSLITKFKLYRSERDKNVDNAILIDRLRNAIRVEPRDWEVVEGIQVHIWIVFGSENAENLSEISHDVVSRFENVPEFQVSRFYTKPYDANPWRNYAFIGGLMQGFVMLVIPLVLLWEIPNLFYSPKTKETVFEPIKSDWQSELMNAKLRNQRWKSVEINFRYSAAFVLAMLQKSPLGDLIEYAKKIAN